MNAPFLRPHGCPFGVDPVEWRQVVEARIEQLQDTMLSLIEALDTMDGDIDLEPSLAGFDGVNVPTDDREGGDVLDEGEPNDWDGEDSDADEDNGDKEPSLGGLAVMVRNGKLIVDGEGDNSDLEYSLGWGFDILSQGAAHMVNSADRELDETAV